MVNILISIFGASWKTSLVGVVQLVCGTVANYLQSLQPGAIFDYKLLSIQIIVAILSFLSKDHDVSGQPKP
jgi:hypothetical protein